MTIYHKVGFLLGMRRVLPFHLVVAHKFPLTMIYNTQPDTLPSSLPDVAPNPMSNALPTILALDFDGVLCDGMIEYFQTAWRAYCRIWPLADHTPPDHLAPAFCRARPVVETGWEMPLVLRSLLLGTPEADILQNWGAIAKQLVVSEQLNPADLSAAVDGTRDEWIAAKPEDWLAQHRFYPGVIERLSDLLSSSPNPDLYTVIISTKEARFIHQLLHQHGVEISDSQVIGKEIRQPKAETLRQLTQHFSPAAAASPTIWFVEDRFKTLQAIQVQPDLANVQLFLADWGYNTAPERAAADRDAQIHLISLEQFSQDFYTWLTP